MSDVVDTAYDSHWEDKLIAEVTLKDEMEYLEGNYNFCSTCSQ